MEYLAIGPSSMGIFAFMGCLKQHEHKLKNIIEISGSSAGALLGLFLALEIPLDDALDKLLKLDIASLMKYNIRTFLRKYGLIDRDTVYNALVEMYGCNPKFSELKKKLHVATYNLNRGKTEYFSIDTHPSMYVLDAIYMSISIPFLGSVKPYNGHIYLDGGTGEDVPITPFIGKPVDKIITLKLFIQENYVDKISTFTEFINTILSRIVSLRKDVDLTKICKTIYVSTGGFNLFNFELTHDDKLRLFLLGYNSS
jgi:predicted acylesterase/phospholipase RssA